MAKSLSNPDSKALKLPWMAAFLLALRKIGNVSEACEKAGISRQVAYHHRDHDAEFRGKWALALEDAVDALEKVAWRRAMGYRGEPDTSLLKFLLTAYKPERFKQSGTQIIGAVFLLKGKDGAERRISSIEDLNLLPTADLEMLAGELEVEEGDYKMLEGESNGHH